MHSPRRKSKVKASDVAKATGAAKKDSDKDGVKKDEGAQGGEDRANLRAGGSKGGASVKKKRRLSNVSRGPKPLLTPSTK